MQAKLAVDEAEMSPQFREIVTEYSRNAVLLVFKSVCSFSPVCVNYQLSRSWLGVCSVSNDKSLDERAITGDITG